jgi:hypothetical protein
MICYGQNGRPNHAKEEAEMATLSLSAPAAKKTRTPFPTIVATSIAPGYIISSKCIGKLVPGSSTVAVLDKTSKKRAEAIFDKLVPAGFAKNVKRRYNVHIKDLKIVHYVPVKFGHDGVVGC